jgi:hypothetical protein
MGEEWVDALIGGYEEIKYFGKEPWRPEGRHGWPGKMRGRES